MRHSRLLDSLLLALVSPLLGAQEGPSGPELGALLELDGEVAFDWDSGALVPSGEASGEALVPVLGELEVGEVFGVRKGTWPRVRVLGIGEEWARVEVLGEDVPREPRAVEVLPEGSGVRLQWEAVAGLRYQVWRMPLERGSRALRIGSVEGGGFEDEAPLGQPVYYYVHAEGAELGALGMGLAAERALEEPIVLGAGRKLDLLTGGERSSGGHIEVRYAGDSAAFLESLGGTLLSDPHGEEWKAPRPGSGSYMSGSHSVRAGQTLTALLPEGIFVRIRLATEDGKMVLRREMGPHGGACIPGPPVAAPVEWIGRAPLLGFEGPDAEAPVEAYELHIEVERAYQSGQWEELAVVPAAAPEIELEEFAAGELVRVRARYGMPGVSWTSLACAPVEVLGVDPRDAVAREAAFDRAMVNLGAGPYRDRQLGHGTLVALGSSVLPALRDVLAGAEDAQLARSLTHVLQEIEGDEGAHLAVVLKAYARELGVESEAPVGWLDEDPLRRARAFLSDLRDGARQPGEARLQRDWLGVLSGGDPDAGVASLARLALERPQARGRRLPDGVPAVLVPPAWRPGSAPLPDVFGDRERARARLLSGLDAHAPRAALVELLVAERLGEPMAQEAGRDGAQRLADALGLVQHHRELGDSILIDAAAALVAGPRANLAAWRELAARRLDWPAEVDLEEVRPRIVLEEATFGALEQALEDLTEEGLAYVDLVLPAGRYTPPQGRSSWLEVDVAGLRILGEGEVVIEAGLRVMDVQDLVLEHLAIEHGRGAALYLAGGSMTLVDVRLMGSDTSATLMNAWLEGERVEMVSTPERRGSTFSVRMQERSGILLRDSLVASGGLFASGESLVYLESSVLVAGERHAFQGTRDGRLVLRDVWVRGEAGGVHGLRGGQFEGVLMQVARDPLGVPATGAALCPDHVLVGEDCEGAHWLTRCPLDDR